MRFVFLSHNYSPTVTTPGDWFEKVKIYVVSLELLTQLHEVIRIEQINYEGTHLHNGIEYHFVNFKKRKSYIPWRLHRLVSGMDPDIVIVHGLHNPLQTIQLRLHLGRKPKIIIQNHAEKPFWGWKKILQRLADVFVQAYFFASGEMGLEWVQRGNLGSKSKIHEVMEVSSAFHPISKQVARSDTGASGFPIFLWVGRLNQNKDPITVTKAFLEFAHIHPSAKLYMIFHTTELLPDVEKLIKEDSQVGKSIVLVGEVRHDELLNWYNSADFIVSGSYYEGSGTAICEAMSCGCVPVVTDIASFRMMTGKGNCGILYKPGDVPDLLRALKQTLIMEMQEEREKALVQFREKLSFEAIAEKIQKVAISLKAKK